MPVSELIWERLGYSVLQEDITIILIWFAARALLGGRRYSIGDYVFTLFGFIGHAIPDFLLALILTIGVF